MSNFVFEPAECIPFRDKEAIARCRAIKREDLEKHPNPDFKIKIVPGEDVAFLWFADLIARIRRSSEAGEQLVMILPNPWPCYRHLARIINECRLDCRNVWAFAMDEYADQDGNVAPESWEFGFSHAMLKFFYYEIDEALRPTARTVRLLLRPTGRRLQPQAGRSGRRGHLLLRPGLDRPPRVYRTRCARVSGLAGRVEADGRAYRDAQPVHPGPKLVARLLWQER